MSVSDCPSCDRDLAEEFRFCPYCGLDLHKPVICPSCKYPNESGSKFCQECGTPITNAPVSGHSSGARPAESRPALAEMEPPPNTGITIEFAYSSAQTFDFALDCAKKFPTFQQYGDGKKAIYRVTLDPQDMSSAIELIEYLKGWRRRTVYVNGEKMTWDSVFSFMWCHERKKASFKPELYCFGYDSEHEFNVWGCIQAHMPFAENSHWFCWGNWLNERGDWRFDKERIKHELQKALYPYRYCPALQPELIEDVLHALPDAVNPAKDSSWKFVERWHGESLPGLAVTVNRFGYQEKVVMKGVSPSGQGALRQLGKRMRFRLPQKR